MYEKKLTEHNDNVSIVEPDKINPINPIDKSSKISYIVIYM